VNACGVAMAMLPGKSWAPHLSNGHLVNVGTVPGLPSLPVSQAGSGQVRRRLLGRGPGGVFVVVRDRESRSHGEGRQSLRSRGIGRVGGRW
jgi:hypothetical protein